MKNYILGLLSVFFIGNHAVMAQDCSKSFFALKENTRFSMGHFDAKGKLTSTSESTIKSVTKTDAGFTADVTATMKNDKGKSLVDGKSYTVTCDNGTIKMDIGSMFTGDMANQMKNMEMTITGDGIDIPATLTEGMSLKGGASTIKMGSNGMNFMTMTFDITNRNVE